MKTSSFSVPAETPPNFFSSFLNVTSASYTRTTFGLNVSTRFLAIFCGKEFRKYLQTIQWSNANRSPSRCSTMEARSPTLVDIWVNRISSGNGNFFIIISQVLVNATAARIHPEILVKTPTYRIRRSCKTASGRRRLLVLLPKQNNKMPQFAMKKHT